MDFYVYVYLREDGSPYYVGKGKGDRWKEKRFGVSVPPIERIIFPITKTTEDWAFFIEMDLIDHYGRLNDGTGILENFTDGGEGPSGAIVSPEVRRKRGKALRGMVTSAETKRKISEALKGRKRPEEVKRKISKSLEGNRPWNKNKPMREETKKKLSKSLTGRKGKPMSEQTKRKLREKFVGKPLSTEHRKKLSKAHKGNKLTEETKKKLSEAMKNYHRRKKKTLSVNEHIPLAKTL